MSPSESKGYPFLLVNAFTLDTFSGNPAAILFLDKLLPIETLQGIARNFNQPITSVITPSTIKSEDITIANFDICWFTGAGIEIPLCGHGTLATAKAFFEYPGSIDTTQVKTIHLRTRTGGSVIARKVDSDDEWFEISLAAAEITPLGAEEEAKISKVIARAAGRDNVRIKFAAQGIEGFTKYIMIELDKAEDLAGTKFNTEIFRETGHEINILTTESISGNEVYLTRMFAPSAGVNEDQVCGSANCLMGPYWAEKKGFGSKEMRVRQVSARGGDIKVECQDRAVKLRGQAKLIGKGEIYV